MKKIIFIASLMALGLASCSNSSKNKVDASNAVAVNKQVEGTPLNVDLEQSSIYWKGSKVGGSHEGSLNLSEGNLILAGDSVLAGDFTIDLNTMASIDFAENAAMAEKLLGHLKSADFFDVAKYPTSTFQITSVTPSTATEGANYEVSGNLTMKDITKNISFPANITKETKKNDAEQDVVVYKAESKPFSIDRTQWNVMFGSKSLTSAAKDALVNDDIELQITVFASPK